MNFAGEGAFEFEVGESNADDTVLMAASQLNVDLLLFVAAGTMIPILALLELLRCVYLDTTHQ